ncbi:MAG: hypothetical protein R3E12_20475 [Candidatus Eisenbacteria bacterium]|uniref:ADP,ATP carrier protein n=1 Tax=Eiseniibacteriota bacterium TaxID=2212470 RepID=A0A956LV75_UNCEI|nr:hypothetical protein [Candidatus Eisenbacteria bacterium]
MGAFLALVLILAGHTLLETARDALFLARIPASRLPWTYLGIALLALAIFAVQRFRGRTSVRRGSLVRWLALSSVITLGFWGVEADSPPAVLYGLYIWSGLFATLVVVRFWTLLGEYFSIGQAKRLFGLIGAGSVLGSILGSALARLFVAMYPARMLLLAAALAILAGGAVIALVLPRRPHEAHEGGDTRRTHNPVRTIWEAPYLRRVGAIVLLSTLAFTLVDYLFKSTIAARVPADRLGSAFATAYLGFNIASLAVQLLLVRYLPWLARVLRIHQLLFIVPWLLGTAAAVVLTVGGLVPIIALKGVDGALRHSLHRTVSEMLYVHLVTDLRSVVKGWIDVAGQRGGQALASFLILSFGMMGAPPPLLAGMVILLVVLWIYTAASITPHYLQLFRRTLAEGSIASRVGYPELDVPSLAALLRALNSRDDGEVVAAVDLLAEQGRDDVLPGLILYHPSSRVVRRALTLFTKAGREDVVPILDRLLDNEDPEVRAAALRARAWLAPDPALNARMLEDPSPIVSATARVGIIALFGGPDAYQELVDLARESDDETRVALARAIRYSPGAAYAEALITLCKHGSLEVRRETALAMHELRSTRCIPSLVQMLTVRDLRESARSGLVAIGSEALSQLEETLDNPWIDPHVRRHLPRTIMRFRSQQAVDVLQNRLSGETDPVVSHKILRALGRLRADDPTLELDQERLRGQLEEEVRAAFRMLEWEASLAEAATRDPVRATEVHELILGWTQHRGRVARERITRVLGLLHPDEDLLDIYRGLDSRRSDKRASSRELLENLLTPPVQGPLLALLDELSPRARLAQAGPYRPERTRSYSALLEALLDVEDVGVRSLVAAHAAEAGVRELIPRLESLPSDPAGMVSEAVARALADLQRPKEVTP